MTASLMLACGRHVLVDDEDAGLLLEHKWYPSRSQTRRENYYAMASVGGKTIYLHRLIMKAPKGVTVDHINRDGLDNRKANLRLASQSENNANREVRNSTGFRGVVKHRSKFRAFISAPRTEARAHFHLGCFSTAEEAARAYDKAARTRWGAFAQLNFPQEP